ncbi:CAP domain-containing protein [Actinomadura sp. ATCC 31491]|uniref:CAP domain-containing protein n=1 Tax=Actinomadura luzonensis TaxID=2805427 RepID=A0ABT0FS04_9ACTN|nr:CAP domain-containing protein [Actinomadura luzonensis]MCK2215119.1 CAP domain-containing protein [Actinomadura luzonensis]
MLTCLMAAVLFTGVLIGRLTDDPQPDPHIYLNGTAPPAAATANPAPTAGRRAAQQLESIPREVTANRLPGGATPKPTARRTDGQIPGSFDAQNDPTQVLGDEQGAEVALIPGLASRVVTLTNQARSRSGCGPLRVDGGLTRSARVHALEMARSGRLTHNSPSGASPWDRMERAGYRYGAAENIGAGYSTPEEAVRGWLDSDDHRRNILDCRLKAIGVGVASGPDGPWWTQDFGTQ